MLFCSQGIVRVRNFSPRATVYGSLPDRLTLKRMSSVRRKSLRTPCYSRAEKFLIARLTIPFGKISMISSFKPDLVENENNF